jgi:hypothetical protein
MWKIKDNGNGKSKLENAKMIKEAIEVLKEDIKEIINIEVGINVIEGNEAYDIVLDSQFASIEDLKTYQKHPVHVEVVKSLADLLGSKVVVDYEMNITK